MWENEKEKEKQIFCPRVDILRSTKTRKDANVFIFQELRGWCEP
jgi:hypothetical protein